jgi:hypothetical protein
MLGLHLLPNREVFLIISVSALRLSVEEEGCPPGSQCIVLSPHTLVDSRCVGHFQVAFDLDAGSCVDLSWCILAWIRQ